MSNCSDGAQKVETENVVDTIKETSSTPTEEVVEDDQEYFDNSFDIFNFFSDIHDFNGAYSIKRDKIEK